MRQQNPKFPYNITDHIEHWSQRPTVLLLGGSLLILVIILILAGGLFFWTYQLITPVFANNSSTDQSELEVARAVIQNMKRMVGDQVAWSESIQEEYNKIFANQSIKTEFHYDSYNDNFIGTNYSINQEVSNQISIK